MSTSVIVTFLASTCFALFLSLLFMYEGKRGRRFGESFRERLDIAAVKIHGWFGDIWARIFRYTLPQMFRFLWHRVLQCMLALLRSTENSLRNRMRHNKARARDYERTRSTLNKLEEIQIHKTKVALTEEEKREHLARSLER